MRKSLVVGLAVALLAAACASDDDGDRDNDGTAVADDDGSATDDSPPDPDGGGFTAEVTIGDDERLQPAECQGENVAHPDHGVTEDSVNVRCSASTSRPWPTSASRPATATPSRYSPPSSTR